uniref:Uncharacterized protein n=1 Tax=Arundo donax TaxID=35708 RepID=A0A0A9FXI8_ARUDO
MPCARDEVNVKNIRLCNA